MTDWREAGLKADAHRVRDLYRAAFNSESKLIARGRVIEALRAAGVTTVLDLWGGGGSADQFVAAGFRVIAVENGSMELVDRGQLVSRTRKRRALEYIAREGGYEARWGSVETFANEADGAYLDFCGPWSVGARRAVTACRHMKAVAVTLTPDHDLISGATSWHERQMAYQLFLKMAWAERPSWSILNGMGNVRRLLDYRRTRGYSVFVYLLSHARVFLPPMTFGERLKTRPDRAKRYRAKALERHHVRYATDSTYRENHRLRSRHARHSKHQRVSARRQPCALCTSPPVGGGASPSSVTGPTR